jgi:hypothetical protein
MPERMTKDLDILVAASDGDQVLERLKSAGYKQVSRLAVPGYFFRSPKGAEVDVLPRHGYPHNFSFSFFFYRCSDKTNQ